jgi:hypothetical protein
MTMATTITSVTAPPINRRSVLRVPCAAGGTGAAGPGAAGPEGAATKTDGAAAEDARALAGAAAAASEGAIASHTLRALLGERPFDAEVALAARGRIGRNYGYKERAVADLLSDLLIPDITAPQLAAVEPHLDSRRTQTLANELCHLRILRGVAQEYSA